MPIIKSAKKKMRSDRRKRARNLAVKGALKHVVTVARRTPQGENIKIAQKALDKAVTAHLIHKNKAARLKSRLVKKSRVAA